jgi:D-alanyl-D-alanine carboxypeptidase (penicillin-binding protein 5/6)
LSACNGGVDTIFHRTDPYELIIDFEKQQFNRSFNVGTPFTSNIAVATTDIPMEGIPLEDEVFAGALFSINNPRVLYGHNMFERLYPASTTKVMTALLAIHHGDMEDIVTVSENAVSLGWYAQVGGLRAGDQVSMRELVTGLMLHSGNDNAVAIAEHISGTEGAFVQLMNEKAYALGATHTNFANSHGLHDENQFSTLYDLYLIFNSLARDQRFLDVIGMPYITARITDNYGEVRYERWYPTNWYNAGVIPHPYGVTVLGGKTGTTDEAGACLILFSRNENDDYYISIIMGAPTRDGLYHHMTFLLSHGIAHDREDLSHE